MLDLPLGVLNRVEKIGNSSNGDVSYGLVCRVSESVKWAQIFAPAWHFKVRKKKGNRNEQSSISQLSYSLLLWNETLRLWPWPAALPFCRTCVTYGLLTKKWTTRSRSAFLKFWWNLLFLFQTGWWVTLSHSGAVSVAFHRFSADSISPPLPAANLCLWIWAGFSWKWLEGVWCSLWVQKNGMLR